MDGFFAAVWIIRIAFLALLYLFLYVVVRVLIRDLRAAAREPGIELGRVIVVTSPSGDPPVGSVFPLDAVTILGRDVNNTIVLEDQFASVGARVADIPRAGLVRRGPRKHERHVCERQPRGGSDATRIR